ncbi:MAG: tetrahydromethanopterin S-methyltransferase subunit C [Candidatus Nezhaarchaeota archaeon]|nr:tetrahydromethanopterin S-methyltransferase subunit C [Candidatus Nezhaarchaeota archaeon]MCX8141481.1 tetrahydromethanopterin S-methyltransferase subunit C [Candidatus Nezhaarchaeota archaeon]MDW8049747.1 tetrahydromethanopterin S-methyltransferase subunit C [Nitrososphaerota archaeon]
MKKVTIEPNKLMVMGLTCGLIGAYTGVIGNEVAGLIAGILALPAIIWGADAVRRIASYGLGTGVPSIGNLSSSMGLLAALVGLAYQPILGAVLAAIAGAIYGTFVAKFKILEVPRLPRYTTELALAACLAITCLTCCVMGYYNPIPRSGFIAPTGNFKNLFEALFMTGFVATIFWITSVAMLHPFNAGLGVGERQGRTLKIAVVTGGIALTLAGVARTGYLIIFNVTASTYAYTLALATIAVGIAIWVGGIIVFLKTAIREAASALWTGLPPKAKK